MTLVIYFRFWIYIEGERSTEILVLFIIPSECAQSHLKGQKSLAYISQFKVSLFDTVIFMAPVILVNSVAY